MPILEALAYEDYYSHLGEIIVECVVICGELDKTTHPGTRDHSPMRFRMLARCGFRAGATCSTKKHLRSW